MATTADPDGGRLVGDDTSELESRLSRYPAARYPVQHATTAFHLGTALLQRGQVPKSLAQLDAAYEIFDRLGMGLERAKTLTMRGVAQREAGRSDLAQRDFENAVDAFAGLEQPAEQGAASYNLGLVLQQLGHEESAQQAMAAARGLFILAGQPAQAGAASRERGAALLRSGRAEQALPLLEEAASLAERGRDLPGLGASANALGLAHLAVGNPAAAVAALTRAVGAFPRSMRPAEHAMTKANLALAHEQSGNPARARLAARQAQALPSADPQVRAQAGQVLDRLRSTTQQDLLTVLETEPLERWPAIVREEALRWCDATSPQRAAAVGGFVDGLLSRPDLSYDLAESLFAVLLELPPDPYGELVTALVQVTGGRTEDERGRIHAVAGSAMARFAIPQWQRLAASLNAAATASGQPAGWR